jgi:UDP-2,3-diacylglucosamine pyrophosphatase LpxH
VLVFISDLHFRDEAALTVSHRMTEGFLKRALVPMVRDAKATEVEVVFLGDLLDINRSRHWVDGSSRGLKPWSHWKWSMSRLRRDSRKTEPGFDASRFERSIIAVLDDIRHANERNYEWWSRFKRIDDAVWGTGPAFRPARVSLKLIVGNHDRLAQFSPAVRRRVALDLALDHPDPEQPFDWIGVFPAYSAVALHGHLLDPTNFGGGDRFPDDPVNSPWYEVPPLGDVVTVMFGIELIHRCARLPQIADNPQLAATLSEIDLVRPQAAAMRWLNRWKAVHREETTAALDGVVVALLDDFMNEPIVRRRLPWYIKLPYRLGIRPTSLEAAHALFHRMGGGPRTVEDYTLAMARLFSRGPLAAWIRDRSDGLRYVVSGHTHRPAVIPLSGDAGTDACGERVYFNTGTWQEVIEEGMGIEGGFARRRQISHVTLYKEGEDVQENEKRSYWEFWQGNVREGSIETPTRRPPSPPFG